MGILHLCLTTPPPGKLKNKTWEITPKSPPTLLGNLPIFAVFIFILEASLINLTQAPFQNKHFKTKKDTVKNSNLNLEMLINKKKMTE